MPTPAVCPRCRAETLKRVCWVPCGNGAYPILECPECHTLVRGDGARVPTSGEYPIETSPASVQKVHKTAR